MSVALPNETSISDVLREGRVRLGGGEAKRFPQPRMAELLGVSLRQYQRWERGASRPSTRAIDRIRRTLAQEQSHQAHPGIVAQVEALHTEIRALRAELDALRGQRA